MMTLDAGIARRIVNFNLWGYTLFALTVWASPAVGLTDDAGHSLQLSRPPQRILSLAPSLTEMLYEVGGGDKLVGAVDYSDYPPAARKVPRIGSNQRLDLERIAALKPDLALVWHHGNAAHEMDRLHALKIPMFYFEPHRIEDIPGVMQRIGALVGHSDEAAQSAKRFQLRHAALKTAYQNRSPVRVFFQVASQPLLTINNQQIIADALALCGGVNVFGEETLLVPQISVESVVGKRPEVILIADTVSSEHWQPQLAFDDPSLKRWQAFSEMPAVKNRQFWRLPADQISRHGPRILDGAEAVCVALDKAREGR